MKEAQGARMSRFRPLRFERFEQRLLLTAGLDPSSAFPGEPTGTAGSQVIEATPSAHFRLELSDLSGQPVTSIQAGEEFLLNAYVADLRSEAAGVFSAYLDVSFDSGVVVPTGNVEFGPQYGNGLSSGESVPGLLDEVGAFSVSRRPIGGGDFLLFRAPFRAETAGTVSFTAQPANLFPDSYFLLFGEYAPLASERIDFGSASMDVLGPPDASVQDAIWPTAAFFDLELTNPLWQLSAYDTLEFAASLSGADATGIASDLLFVSVTPAPHHRTPTGLEMDRDRRDLSVFDFQDLGIDLADGFKFADRSLDLDQMLEASNLSMERTPGTPEAFRFSLREPPDFLLDRYEPRSFSDPVGGARGDSSMRSTSLLHDQQWLTVGLLRIEWRGERRYGQGAEIGEMFDLAQIAYDTIGSTRVPGLDELRLEDDEEEWIAGLDGLFSEEAEVDGVQGTLMAVEADVLADHPVRPETSRHRDSREAAPTDSRTTGTEENPDRAPKNDHTPAA
jgi:hypothetical protein